MTTTAAASAASPTRAMKWTVAELAFIATMIDGRGAELLRAAIDLDEADASSPALLRSGYGALRLRDWIVSEGDEMTPDDGLAAFASVVGEATALYRVGAASGESALAFSVLMGRGPGVMLRADPDGVVTVGAVESTAVAIETLTESVQAAMEEDGVDIVSIEARNGTGRHVIAMRSTEGGWQVAMADDEIANNAIHTTPESLDLVRQLIARTEPGHEGAR